MCALSPSLIFFSSTAQSVLLFPTYELFKVHYITAIQLDGPGDTLIIHDLLMIICWEIQSKILS